MKQIGLFIFLAILVSCSNSEVETTNSDKSPFEAGGAYDQELAKEIEAYKREEDSIYKANLSKMTDIAFDGTMHDFGKVKAESQNEFFFVFKNTGKKPLIIESVRASCGCTTPIKPNKPILPGQKDSIQVKFAPFPGMKGHVEKTVTVKSNTFIPVNELFISAEVE